MVASSDAAPSGVDGPGPLAGRLVVDLTRVLAGPYCTMVLSDLGARVIKVEPPGTGDDARHFGPFVNGQSAYFMSLNRGKESIALNLKADEDRGIFEALLAKADVLVENYRAGALEKLGYGWDRLRMDYPRLVYAAASGFGQTGPYKTRAAYDMVVQGMGGIMSVTGHPGGEPTRVGASIGDITAGLFTTIGILSALNARETSSKGAMVDIGMLDCQVAILENAIARYAVSGKAPGPLGARHPSIAPFEAFATDDSHIIVAAGNDKLFAQFCAALGAPEIASDPRFADNRNRCENADALKTEIESRLTRKGAAHWLETIEAAGVPCGPINDVPAVLADPQVRHRNMVVTATRPDAGELIMAGNPIKISGVADPATRGAIPELDGDREAILREIVG